MPIGKKEIEHITNLARIRLDNKEEEKMAGELGAVLDYVDKLKEVDTEGVEPISNITGLENVTRNDDGKPSRDGEEAKKLADMAPEKKNNYIKVPAVFGE